MKISGKSRLEVEWLIWYKYSWFLPWPLALSFAEPFGLADSGVSVERRRYCHIAEIVLAGTGFSEAASSRLFC